MLTALAYVAGAATIYLLERYVDHRRHVRNEAWQEIASRTPMRLSEAFRLQGIYDTPEY